MGLAGVGWRDGEKMQTIVTEFKKTLKKEKVITDGVGVLLYLKSVRCFFSQVYKLRVLPMELGFLGKGALFRPYV